MADKTIGELPNLPAISPLDLLVAQHNEEATKITGATLTNFFKDYIGPVAVTSASQMTNTNKVYIYVGNESGYTNGDWYYYNGSRWVSGGAYNSQAINTDATLTHQGVAADAEAAGKIVEISETQPAAPANRVWIPETQESTVQIPTWAEHQALDNAINGVQKEITSHVQTTLTANRAYTVGEYLVYNGRLYRVVTNIANGGTITIGTNVVGTYLDNELQAAMNFPIYQTGGGLVEITDSAFGFIDTGISASDYLLLAVHMWLETNVAVRISSIMNGNYRIQLITATTGEIVKSGNHRPYYFYMRRSDLTTRNI